MKPTPVFNTPFFAAIGPADLRHLLNNPGAQVLRFRNCTLGVSADGDSFVMRGPTPGPALAVAGTDIARLNAHWQVYATHPRNNRHPDPAKAIGQILGETAP
jgi:hypothetical protein